MIENRENRAAPFRALGADAPPHGNVCSYCITLLVFESHVQVPRCGKHFSPCGLELRGSRTKTSLSNLSKGSSVLHHRQHVGFQSRRIFLSFWVGRDYLFSVSLASDFQQTVLSLDGQANDPSGQFSLVCTTELTPHSNEILFQEGGTEFQSLGKPFESPD